MVSVLRDGHVKTRYARRHEYDLLSLKTGELKQQASGQWAAQPHTTYPQYAVPFCPSMNRHTAELSDSIG